MKNNIKTIREQQNLTQKDCADIFGVTLRAWQTYEQGISDPKYDVLCKIADYFKVTLDYLLGRETAPVNPYAYLPADAKEQEAVEKFLSLSEDTRKAILTAMDMLIAEMKAERETITAATLFIDYYSEPASAGTGYYLDSSAEPPQKLEIIDTPEARQADFAIRISGDSMETDLSDGDIVLIQSYAHTDIRPGDIGVFIQDGEGYVKELGDGVLISHNPTYPPIQMQDGTTAVGKVLGKATVK